MTHRELAIKRLLDGWEKFAHEQPEINFGLSESIKEIEASHLVKMAIKEYENGSPLSVVRDAFNLWKQAWIEKCKPQTLFT